MDQQKHIRNFAIVAHIDHGKSTLADRLLEQTHTIDSRHMTAQVLDSNPIERERGITIKLAPVRMKYRYNNEEYILNLIDTPGHVDFSYEVSRSLAACEGIILVVDATQGIQAQTVAHMLLVKSKNLKVIPVVNKIDLPTAKVDSTVSALIDIYGFKDEEIIRISAKTGLNVNAVLKAIVERIPAPGGNSDGNLRALVFSSVYESHRGVIIFIRVVDGNLDKKSILQLYAANTEFSPVDIGYFLPQMVSKNQLLVGEVGYIATGLKDTTLAKIGDTLTDTLETIQPLPGYKEPKPMVFLSFYPTDNDHFPLLREALEKLHLSDSSFTFELHSSAALGKGFLCGFLGLLHADVLQERLEREFNLNIIASAPTVEYQIELSSGKVRLIHTPEDFPDLSLIRTIKEPIMYVSVFTPKEFVGNIMRISQEKRGDLVNLEYLGDQAKFTYLMPLSEMIIDFFDKLKSITSGYASLDYEFYEYRSVKAVKLEFLLNKNKVEAFSQIVVLEKAQSVANWTVEKLKELIPRHQFQVPIQAAIGGKIIARADVKSFRKDVTAKLYGGDQSRKDKLLDAQKKGKKKMKQFGKVEIPQEVFLKLYKE